MTLSIDRRWSAVTRHAVIAAACILGSWTSDGSACSDVILPHDPVAGQVVSARTLDFSLVDQTVLTAVTLQAFERNRHWQSDWQGLGNGKAWRNKYGFVGMHALGHVTQLLNGRVFNLDGLNEAGLSAAFLWLEETEYPPDIPADGARSVSMVDAVNYIVGNFATVAEVKAALTDPHNEAYVQIWGLPLVSALVPLHVVAHDAQRNTLIVEWTGKTQHVYDGAEVDAVGVLTNDPAYPQQIDNLRRNYGAVTPDDALRGVPGDMGFMSRFVRLAKLREFAHLTRGSDRLDAAQVAAHLINNVDVVFGSNREPVTADLRIDDYTGPVLIRDHKRRILYFKGHNNQGYRKIDLTGIDFARGQGRGILADPQPTDAIHARYTFAQDVTAMLGVGGSTRLGPGGLVHRLSLNIPVAAADREALGFAAMYVYAITPQRQVIQWSDGRWIPTSARGNLEPAWEGALEPRTIEVTVDGLADGTEVYVGYGTSDLDMLANQRQRLAFVVSTARRQ